MKKLLEAAVRAQSMAHAPYSKFRVGAALIDASGRLFSGCNIENASFGATICAERAAIGCLVSQEGAQDIREILICTDDSKGTPPCGICRQVLAEFASNPEELKVHLATPKGVVRTLTLSQLMPEIFRL